MSKYELLRVGPKLHLTSLRRSRMRLQKNEAEGNHKNGSYFEEFEFSAVNEESDYSLSLSNRILCAVRLLTILLYFKN